MTPKIYRAFIGIWRNSYWRHGGLFLLAFIATIASTFYLFDLVQANSARQQLDAAEKYYQKRFVRLEENWLDTLDALKSQIEFLNLRDINDDKDRKRLIAYLTNLGPQLAFSGIEIINPDGAVVFSFPSGKIRNDRAKDQSGKKPPWILDRTENNLFWYGSNSLWIGGSSKWSIGAYIRAGNGLLNSIVFPFTAISLELDGQTLATSDNNLGEAGKVRSIKIGNLGPVLQLRGNFEAPISLATVLVFILGAALVTLAATSFILATRFKQAELALLIEVESKKAASAAKSQFVSSISHELRTPLNAIRNYLLLISEEMESLERPDIMSDLQKVNLASDHLLDLINQVLDLSKIESGHMDLSIRSFDLRSFMQELASIAAPLVAKNGNRFEFVSDEILGKMDADPLRLRQCLLNLIGNAAKFTENGVITICVAATEEFIEWRIQDTGIGMSPEQLGRIFKPFQQADSTISTRFGGTGLGLSLTSELISLMGGTIGANSTLGIGSSFKVRLPRLVEL
jgi:signal transduction histidine kinase